MKPLLMLLLLCPSQEDDKKKEEDRIELWKRIAPAIAGERGIFSPSTLGSFSLNNYDLDYKVISTPSTTLTSPLNYSLSTGSATTDGALFHSLSTASLTSKSSQSLVGFFLDDNGLFVTTTEGLTDSKIQNGLLLHDGRRCKVRLVTEEEKVGLALLQVETQGPIRYLPLADSSTLQPGQTVMVATVAGHSPVLRQTVVIGRDRDAIDTYSVEDFLHIDYPALRGELGAAVLNLKGEVIGILAKTAFESDENGPLIPRRAYAIPSNTIRAFLSKRDAQGRFEIGYIGIDLEEGATGATVKTVYPDSPAAKADLRAGDVITHIADKPVRNYTEIGRIVRFRARESVELRIERGGEKRSIPLTLGVYEPPKPELTPSELTRQKTGLTVMDLTDALRKFLSLLEGTSGVVIDSVEAGSAAEQAGLRKGDVISAADNTATGSSEVFLNQMKEFSADTYVVLETWRDGKKVPVVLKVR